MEANSDGDEDGWKSSHPRRSKATGQRLGTPLRHSPLLSMAKPSSFLAVSKMTQRRESGILAFCNSGPRKLEPASSAGKVQLIA